MNKAVVVVFAGLALLGCKDEKVVQTKQWYKDHDSERKARVEVCRNDAREEAKPDCRNALEAEASVFLFGKDPSNNKSPDINPQ